MKLKIATVLVALAVLIGGGAAPATAQTVGHPRIIDFRTGPQKMGLAITRLAMVRKLVGTSPAFKRYIAQRLQELIDHHACARRIDEDITVDKYATDGYALGGVTECGGYRAIWGVRDGAWHQLIGTQDVFRCGQLHRDRVPIGLLDDGKCYVRGVNHLVQYRG